MPQPQFLRKAFGPFVVAPNKEEHVQPFGSAIALMLMASWALKHDIVDVYYAVHSNDAVFHDNHASYFEALHTVTVECEGDEYGVTFHTPYLSINKCAVIQKGWVLACRSAIRGAVPWAGQFIVEYVTRVVIDELLLRFLELKIPSYMSTIFSPNLAKK